MADTKEADSIDPSSSRDALVTSIPYHLYQSCEDFIAIGPPGLAYWQQHDNLIRISRIFLDTPNSIVQLPNSTLYCITLPSWLAKKKGMEVSS